MDQMTYYGAEMYVNEKLNASHWKTNTILTDFIFVLYITVVVNVSATLGQTHAWTLDWTQAQTLAQTLA